MNRPALLALAILVVGLPGSASAADYYVSAARGKGKEATKEAPSKDLGIIAGKLQAGDTVHIAEGVYVGKAESGFDEIDLPVKIIGGYSDDFAKRDPWGAHRTVFSGINKSDNFNGARARLTIGSRKYTGGGDVVVDGLIVDSGERNGYADEGGLKITRKFIPKTKTNIAPDQPGISIDVPRGGTATVQNCIVMNSAPHHKTGAIKVFAGAGSKATIRNNLSMNNTGSGIAVLSFHHPRDGQGKPEFLVENNTVLFTWKYDEMSTDCGSSLKIESDTVTTAKGNVFAFADAFGVDNALKSKLTAMKENLFFANMSGPYLEFNTRYKLANIADEAEQVGDASGNVVAEVQVPVSKEWATHYASRTLIDRAVAEASIGAKDNWQNDLRRMLGLPLDGGKLGAKSSPVWLHRLPLEDALKAGAKKLQGKYGCEKPAAQ